MKKNCWEITKCGREPGGEKVKEQGVCIASTKEGANGVHEGENAGRCCWAIAGTSCNGNTSDTYAGHLKDCLMCEFYRQVQHEEGSSFIDMIDMIEMFDHIK